MTSCCYQVAVLVVVVLFLWLALLEMRALVWLEDGQPRQQQTLSSSLEARGGWQ